MVKLKSTIYIPHDLMIYIYIYITNTQKSLRLEFMGEVGEGTDSGVLLDFGEALVVGAVDAEDGAGGDSSINVGRTIKRVKDNNVVS